MNLPCGNKHEKKILPSLLCIRIICLHDTSFLPVPAAILSFSTIVSIPWKMDVNFDCHTVGNPRPELFWTFNSNRIETGQHSNVFSNGTLHLQSVSSSDGGNYTCNVHNIHNSESLIHILRVLGEYTLMF
jgi:Immunoglobulin I-set domain.